MMVEFIENDGLNWLAFRYLSNEMSAAERDAFEQRLLTDTEALETLARTVQLTEAVAAVRAETIETGRVSQPARRRRWVRSVRWMAAAAAACVLGILVLRSFHDRGSFPKAPDDRGSLDRRATASVATVWAESELRQRPDFGQGSEENGDFEESMVQDGADEGQFAVPAWLLEVVPMQPGRTAPDDSREGN